MTAGAPPPWTDIMAAIPMLGPREQAALALLGAERLVGAGGLVTGPLARMVEVGWAQLNAGDQLHPLGAALAELDERDDLDDNEVAVVSFALTAAAGAEAGMAQEATTWAVMRVLDAAFDEASPLDPDEVTSVHQDARHPVVQRELAWLRSAVFSLRQRGSTPDTLAALRAG